MRPVNSYPPFVQLLICLGLYILCTFSFYGVAIGYVLPHYFNISATVFNRGGFSDPHVLHVMKIFQFAYSIFAFLIPALIFFAIWDRQPLKYAGISTNIHWGWVIYSLVLLFVALPGVGILSDWNQLIHFGPFEQSFRAMQQRAKDMTEAMLDMPTLDKLWADLLLIAILPAIAEEFFFRGTVQRILIKLVKSAWLGILITAVFFSLVHGEMFGFFPRVALGVILGAIYYFSGNLWYAVIFHMVNNGFQVVVVYLNQHGFLSVDITQEAPTSLFLGISSMILVVGLLYIYQKYVPQNPQKKLWTTDGK